MLAAGEKAPDFSAATVRGDSFNLAAHQGQVVVLFFFPAAYSPLCSREVADFARSWHDFQELGAEVIGISTDDHQTQCKFAADNQLPYALVSDDDASISSLYGVKWPLLNLVRRVTFVIDPMGVVRNVFKYEVAWGRHAPSAVAATKKIRSG